MKLTDKDLENATPITKSNHITRYMKFLHKFGYETKPKEIYTEHHHIVFKGINVDAKIYLPHRAHMIAHAMLYRIFKDVRSARGFSAATNMHRGNRNKRVEPSPILKRLVSKAMSEQDFSGENHWMHSASDDAINNWKNSLKGRTWKMPKEYSDVSRERHLKRLEKEGYNEYMQERSMKAKEKLRTFTYNLTHKDGRDITLTGGIIEFCKEHELSYGTLNLTSKGMRSHHKGWKLEYINK